MVEKMREKSGKRSRTGDIVRSRVIQYLGVEEDVAVSVASVASGAPDLLDVALKVLGRVVVDDGADVGLVDAHAERHRCHDNAQSVAHEVLLDGRPPAARQARVIRLGAPRDPATLRVLQPLVLCILFFFFFF